MKIYDLSVKEFLGLHSFELAYLCVLAVLPFIVAIREIASVILLILGFIAVRAWLRKVLYRAVKVNGQGVLVTGCDTGFGHTLVKRLDTLGFTVFAGVINEKGDGAEVLRKWSDSKRIHVIKLDVTSDEDISKAVKFVESHCTGLWCVVNNAALNFLGDVEFCTMDMYKKVADVNQFGVIRVTKAFLPMIRKSKGRILNVTSAKGKISLPSNAVYGATKYAIEAFSDVLRLEMRKFGVKVIIVEPGDFGGTTGMLSPATLSWMHKEMETMWDSASKELQQTYGKAYLNAQYSGAQKAAKVAAKTTTLVIDAMEDAIVNVSPSVRYLVDGSNKLVDVNNLLIRMRPFVPDSWLDFILDKLHSTNLETATAK